MKPKTILLIILLFLSPAALGNNAGDDTDALLIAATYIGDGNGTIYCGYGTNPLDAVYTFKNGRIYALMTLNTLLGGKMVINLE